MILQIFRFKQLIMTSLVVFITRNLYRQLKRLIRMCVQNFRRIL